MANYKTLALLFCFAFMATVIEAVDLTKIDRSIKKEPAYESGSPRYALLAFGENADTHIWLVVDGRRLYIDHNANGDLTETGESVLSESGGSFRIDGFGEADGTRHGRFSMKLYDGDRFRFYIELAMGCRQTVGYGNSSYVKPQLAKRPADAPIIHLNGPSTIARYGPVAVLPRNTEDRSYRISWLRILIGSPGLGEGTFAGYNCKLVKCAGGYRTIVADVEFPNRTEGAPPITLRNHLSVRG